MRRTAITVGRMRASLRLLGQVEAHAQGRPVSLGPRKQRLVLAILALEVNRPVEVTRLVDLAWPDGAPRTAEHGVKVCISALRSAFAEVFAGVQVGPARRLSGWTTFLPEHGGDAAGAL